MKNHVLVEIIAYAPTAFYHCTHCEVAFREMGKSDIVHKEQWDSSLPEDLAQEYAVISDWIQEMIHTYDDRLTISVVDAASVEGVIQSLRYRARRYPAFILNRSMCLIGENALPRATSTIQSILASGEIHENQSTE